jgi:MYXO-CTERM domain-containing protein
MAAADQASQAGGYPLPAWATGEPLSTSSTTKSGCSTSAAQDPTHPIPWRAAALALGVAGLGLARQVRRRR